MGRRKENQMGIRKLKSDIKIYNLISINKKYNI